MGQIAFEEHRRLHSILNTAPLPGENGWRGSTKQKTGLRNRRPSIQSPRQRGAGPRKEGREGGGKNIWLLREKGAGGLEGKVTGDWLREEEERGGGLCLIKGPIQGGLHFNSELTFPLLHLGSPFMGLPLGCARCFNAHSRLLLYANTYTGR